MRLSQYMKGGGGGNEKPPEGPVVNGKNQNHYPATERPCLAHGCPELGTITSSLTYSENAHWYCRFHHDKDKKDFKEITKAILEGRNPMFVRGKGEKEDDPVPF